MEYNHVEPRSAELLRRNLAEGPQGHVGGGVPFLRLRETVGSSA